MGRQKRKEYAFYAALAGTFLLIAGAYGSGEKSVQQNGDADRNVGMVFAARTGPLGSTVHFWEFPADRDKCIRTGRI